MRILSLIITALLLALTTAFGQTGRPKWDCEDKRGTTAQIRCLGEITLKLRHDLQALSDRVNNSIALLTGDIVGLRTPEVVKACRFSRNSDAATPDVITELRYVPSDWNLHTCLEISRNLGFTHTELMCVEVRNTPGLDLERIRGEKEYPGRTVFIESVGALLPNKETKYDDKALPINNRCDWPKIQ
jgi:hypothetical protein